MADKHHSFQVARRASSEIGEEGKEFMAAALLHDIGKLESGFTTFGRVLQLWFVYFSRWEKWKNGLKKIEVYDDD